MSRQVAYVVALAGGREWPAQTGLGRVPVRVVGSGIECRWRAADDFMFPKIVDGVGFAATLKGPLVARRDLPRGEHRKVVDGEELIIVVPLGALVPMQVEP